MELRPRRNRLQPGVKIIVHTRSGDQIHMGAQRILQISQQSGESQPTDGAPVGVKINITLIRHIPTGTGTKEIYPLCPVFFCQRPHNCLNLRDRMPRHEMRLPRQAICLLTVDTPPYLQTNKSGDQLGNRSALRRPMPLGARKFN